LPETSINILMTGAGAPGAAGIIHCLQQEPSIKITVADADENSVGKYLIADFVKLPKADHPGFINAVRNLCFEKKIKLVLPLVTKELFPLSKHKEEMEKEGVKVLVSSEASINIANNKSICYQHLQEKEIPVPRFFIANTVEEFIHAAFELGHPQQAFCFKPSIANGSRGFRVVSDSLDESEQLFNLKPYNINITYAHALKILSSCAFPQLLVSEYLPGEEYSVDCLARHGKAVLIVPRSRQKTINGISVQGEFVRDEMIIDYCRQIIEAIGLHGNIGIQVKYSSGNKPLLLEINPRVQGTIAAGLGAGINLPLLAVQQELGLPLRQDEMQVKWGTKFTRYWTEVFY
jgi:carbamoyl-phosphate synthase large subunit